MNFAYEYTGRLKSFTGEARQLRPCEPKQRQIPVSEARQWLASKQLVLAPASVYRAVKEVLRNERR